MQNTMIRRSLPVVLCTLAALFQSAALAQTPERADIPEKYTWKLEDIYPSDEAWAKAKDDLAGQFDKILAFQGTLADSPDQLLACLEFNTAIDKELSRLFSYASMKFDQDMRRSEYQGMQQMLRQMATGYGSKASFVAPEITAMDRKTIDAFIQREPGLKIYRM